jgi:hypothetical protein
MPPLDVPDKTIIKLNPKGVEIIMPLDRLYNKMRPFPQTPPRRSNQ